MAEFTKYKMSGVSPLLRHNNRTPDDNVQRKNTDIDPTLTTYNYHLKHGSLADVQQRLSEVLVLKPAAQNVLGEMIVTLPKNVKEKDERAFFQSVYDFYAQEFGEKNIINAVVHRDETTAHIHLDFVPVVTGDVELNLGSGIGRYKYEQIEKWKQEHEGQELERLCCRECVDKSYLIQMHPRLSQFVEEQLGYKVDILNGATVNGNKTIEELKLEKEIASIEAQIEEKRRLLDGLDESLLRMYEVAHRRGMSQYDIKFAPLLDRLDDLENQVEVLSGIVRRNQLAYSKEDLDKMRERKYEPVKGSNISVFDGSLVQADIDDNAIVIIELPENKERPSPQQEYIDNDDDLHRQCRIARGTDKKVLLRPSRSTDRCYLFVKTDGVEQTLQALLQMEEELRRIDMTNRRIFMDRIENDTYNIAQAILEKQSGTAYYFARRDLRVKNGEEQEKDKDMIKQ